MLSFQAFRLSLLAIVALCLAQRTNALNRREFKSQASQKTRLKLDRNYENFFHFHSRPDIVAPRWEIWMYDKTAISPGYWFIAPYEGLDQITRGSAWVGPFIYDMTGQVVWAGTPMFDHRKSFDLRVADIEGKGMMTVIYPYENAGLILDDKYEVAKRVVYSSNFNYSNMHDFNVIANGNRALVLTKHTHKEIPAPWAESVGIHGGCSVRADGLKELDISGDTTKELFAWNGTDHIGADETTFTPNEYEKMCQSNWDIHHFNAVDEFPDGDYLLSSRHTDTLYKINHKDGSVVWRLGGVKSDFELGMDVRFSRQHHARVRSQNSTHAVVSVFDNAKGSGAGEDHSSYPHSRGLVIALDMANMKATLVAAFHHPRGGITNSRGSNQVLPGDNVFMCWAYHTLVSEHAPDGRMLMEARLKKNIHTYRAYKYEWIGRPTTPPDVYATTDIAGDHPETYTYVSWNGATEVAMWNLYETDARGEHMRPIMSVSKTGFETEMVHYGSPKYILVQATDRFNVSLGQTNVFETVRSAKYIEDPQASLTGAHRHHDVVQDSEAAIDSETADYTYEVRPDSSSWATEDDWVPGEQLGDIFTNPIATFITGFVSCAVACAVFWAAWKYKLFSPWRPRLGAYEQVGKEGDEDDTFVEDESILEDSEYNKG